ncbi:hypothetical protein CLV76_1263 [Marivita geojedonensis]|nr:hypothetical protein CLV76_1263 [Marivita geojedonensis]
MATPVVTVATPVVTVATPVATVATPVVTVATVVTPVATVATPVVTVATPVVTVVTPVATVVTPVATAVTPVATVATPVATVATPVAKVVTPVAKVVTPVATAVVTAADQLAAHSVDHLVLKCPRQRSGLRPDPVHGLQQQGCGCLLSMLSHCQKEPAQSSGTQFAKIAQVIGSNAALASILRRSSRSCCSNLHRRVLSDTALPHNAYFDGMLDSQPNLQLPEM